MTIQTKIISLIIKDILYKIKLANPVSQWQKIMNHNYVITLDEMPDLKIQ